MKFDKLNTLPVALNPYFVTSFLTFSVSVAIFLMLEPAYIQSFHPGIMLITCPLFAEKECS